MYSGYSAPLAGSGVGAGGASSGAGTNYPIAPDPALKYVAKRVLTTAPRALVKVMGIQGIPTEFTVTHNAHGVMDTAGFSIAQKNSIDWGNALKDPMSTDDAIVVEVYAGFPPSTDAPLNITQLSQRFLGILDKHSLSCRGGEWKFECSSLVTLLLKDKQTTLIQGQTTTQYLKAIAAQVGLKTNIILGPNGSAPMSRVFAKMFVVGIHTAHPWSILQACAQTDDCDLWLRGDMIYYWTPYAIQSKPKVIFQYGQDLLELDLEHNPQTNADVQVDTYSEKIKVSHSSRSSSNGKVTTSDHVSVTIPVFGTAGSSSSGFSTNADGDVSSSLSQSNSSGGAYKTGSATIPKASSREVLVYHIPNLTPAEAQAEANTIRDQLSRSEYQATFEFPVTPDILTYLSVETLFELYGSPSVPYNTGARIPLPNGNTVTNYGYFQRQIEETFSRSQGWRAKSTCLNHGTPQGAEENIGAGVL